MSEFNDESEDDDESEEMTTTERRFYYSVSFYCRAKAEFTLMELEIAHSAHSAHSEVS